MVVCSLSLSLPCRLAVVPQGGNTGLVGNPSSLGAHVIDCVVAMTFCVTELIS